MNYNYNRSMTANQPPRQMGDGVSNTPYHYLNTPYQPVQQPQYRPQALQMQQTPNPYQQMQPILQVQQQKNNPKPKDITQNSQNSQQSKPKQQKPLQNLASQQNMNQKVIEDYTIFLNKHLGAGQFGQVLLAQHTPSKTYLAAKVISHTSISHLPQSQQNMIMREVDLLSRAKHENLVCLHGIRNTQNNLYIFMDYCNGGNLGEFIGKKRIQQDMAVEFISQIVAGYQMLYYQNIVHRDLKPENILLNDGKIKIGDYGFGKIIQGDMNQQMKLTKLGTPVYASPQVLLGNAYSSKTDIWSLGVILFELLYGKRPFNANNETMLLKDIESRCKRKKFLCPQNVKVSQQIQDLISSILTFYEKDRISWEELFDHQVIKNYQTSLLTLKAETENIDTCDLHQSIVENRMNVQKQIVLDHQITDDNIRRIKIEDQSDDFQKKQQENIKIQKAHKYFLLMRNKALFANLTLQWFWEAAQKLEIPRILCKVDIKYLTLFKAIVFCCGGYYFYTIDNLNNIFIQSQKQNLINQSEFELYSKSNEFFLKAQNTIEKDHKEAYKFFIPFQTYIMKEFDLSILSYRESKDYNNQLAQLLDSLQVFALKRVDDPNQYIIQQRKLIQKMVEYIKLEQLSFQQLKSIYSVQIFSQLDEFLNQNDFLTIQISQFYDDYLTNVENQDMINNILKAFPFNIEVKEKIIMKNNSYLASNMQK